MDFSLIPNDIVLDIISRCAPEGIDTIRSMRLVSPQFRELCDRNEVLRNILLGCTVPFYPLIGHDMLNFDNFYRRLCDSGNPEALYRTGVREYLCDSMLIEGLDKLYRASELGIPEASFVYDMVCICLGGFLKDRGYNALGKLQMMIIGTTLAFVRIIRENVVFEPAFLSLRGQSHLLICRYAYARDRCICNGHHLQMIPTFEG